MDDHVSYRYKINNLSKIYDGKNLLTTEFINCDLSDIDLSNIPIEKWEGCIFYNTSFKNTGIKFIPNKLKIFDKEDMEKLGLQIGYYDTQYSIYIDYCDFSDNDLTYLEEKDFFINNHDDISKYGCNFRNTGINFLKTGLENAILDYLYKYYDYDFWNVYPTNVGIYTIIKNPFLNIPSNIFINVLEKFVQKKSRQYHYKHPNSHQQKYKDYEYEFKYEVVTLCENFLKYDKQGYARKFYNEISKDFSLDNKFSFFQREIEYVKLYNIKIHDIPIDILNLYGFTNNKVQNVSINNPIDELLKISSDNILDIIPGLQNQYESFYFPSITFSSWQENDGAKKRISSSSITFFTKVYLELSRTCNAKCIFCRNSSFNPCNYNVENIKQTLEMLKNYINAVVIGGGEPTLRLNDVKNLYETLSDSNFDWHMFTNGTNKSLINDDYIMNNFRLNISRHAINDDENANIFRVDNNKVMSYRDIEKLNIRNGQVTLNAVCFNGGLDNFEKIVNYIRFAKDIGCKKVLIQDLQKEISLGNNAVISNNLYIDDSIFFKIRAYLKENGYREKYPIYATGGYVSYILTDKDNFSIALQKYITKEELDKEWPTAIKRTFDLSIDPNGNLYENWNQTTGLVKKLNKKVI